jgi:hypothetical protein
MRKFLSIVLLFLIPALCFSQYLEKTPTGGLVDWTDQLIREVGIGAPNPNLPIGAQRASAIEAAKRVALRNLLERVQGMSITSEVTVQDYIGWKVP